MENKTSAAGTTANVVYLFVMEGNKVVLQRKGELFQLMAKKVEQSANMQAKAIELLREKAKIENIEPYQISSKTYSDKDKVAQKCYVFLFKIDEKHKRFLDSKHFFSVNLEDLVSDKIGGLKLKDISAKIIKDNFAAVSRNLN